MKFNVTFCNANNTIVITIVADSFSNARKIARKNANKIGYAYKDGWKWSSTQILEK